MSQIWWHPFLGGSDQPNQSLKPRDNIISFRGETWHYLRLIGCERANLARSFCWVRVSTYITDVSVDSGNRHKEQWYQSSQPANRLRPVWQHIAVVIDSVDVDNVKYDNDLQGREREAGSEARAERVKYWRSMVILLTMMTSRQTPFHRMRSVHTAVTGNFLLIMCCRWSISLLAPSTNKRSRFRLTTLGAWRK